MLVVLAHACDRRNDQGSLTICHTCACPIGSVQVSKSYWPRVYGWFIDRVGWRRETCPGPRPKTAGPGELRDLRRSTLRPGRAARLSPLHFESAHLHSPAPTHRGRCAPGASVAETHAEQNNNFHPVNKDLLEELLFLLFFSSPSINISEWNAQMVLLLFVRIGSCFR